MEVQVRVDARFRIVERLIHDVESFTHGSYVLVPTSSSRQRRDFGFKHS